MSAECRQCGPERPLDIQVALAPQVNHRRLVRMIVALGCSPVRLAFFVQLLLWSDLRNVESVYYIGNSHHQLGAFLNHPVGEIAGRGEDTPRYAEHLPVLFQGVVDRVTGPTALCRFNHYRP